MLMLFNSYCCSFFGCELWFKHPDSVLRQLAIGYHSTIKRIIGKYSRNHEVCNGLGIELFPTLLARRQVAFYSRYTHSCNPIFRNILQSNVGLSGLLSSRIANIVLVFPEIAGIDLTDCCSSALSSCFIRMQISAS